MASQQMLKRPLDKVYSSVPREMKEAIQEYAYRRDLQVSDVIREFLMEKYADQSVATVEGSSPSE